MNFNIIDFENTSAKTKWLAALVIYCVVIANILWSLGPEGSTFTISTLDNGELDFTFANHYRFWVTILNHVVIIYVVVNAFNGHPKAITVWVCLAALTLLLTAYTLFGFIVLAYVLYPFVKRWMGTKFVEAVKSATEPPNE